MSFTDKLAEYLLAQSKAQLLDILSNPDSNGNYSLVVNFLMLLEENVSIGNGILIEPKLYLSAFNDAAISAQKSILSHLAEDKDKYKIKTKVSVRLEGLPLYSELAFPTSKDIGLLVKINGTLIKSGAPKLLEHQKDYVCSVCYHVTTAKAAYEKYYLINAPTKCEECCSNNLKPKKEVSISNLIDYQEIKVQEHFGKSKVGALPKCIIVTLEGDLVDSCKPGDDVIVTGILLRRWKQLKIDTRCDVDLVLKANNLELCCKKKETTSSNEIREHFSKFWLMFKDRELYGRNFILKSFCPQLFGLYLAKLAMCIVLAGGVEKADQNGFSSRGMSHLLLIGDVGTGKSHLLRYASRIIRNSVYTTGVGSTNAGLTVAAVRENGDWNLEAGALVLADGGICCIDDFNSIREHDRTSIHEAMEQQTISVAKAGIVTKLNTRCSIFAATSIKYDSSVPLNLNVTIASPLLSRFDVVLVLLDSKTSDWDRSLCDFVFEKRKNTKEAKDICYKKNLDLPWSIDELQNYFSVIKNINPVMTPDAGTVLRAYYQYQRMKDNRNAARTTVRLLESLIRLSQGHARLMFREKVNVLDAVTAVTIMESSMFDGTANVESNAVYTMLPGNPYDEYEAQVKLILNKLNLVEILEKEIKSIQNKKKFLTNQEIIDDSFTCNNDYARLNVENTHMNSPIKTNETYFTKNEMSKEIEEQNNAQKFIGKNSENERRKSYSDNFVTVMNCEVKSGSQPIGLEFPNASSQLKHLKLMEGGKTSFLETNVFKTTNKFDEKDSRFKKAETSGENHSDSHFKIKKSFLMDKGFLDGMELRKKKTSKFKNIFTVEGKDDLTWLDF